MEKIGRNDPCPCGSGRKYKQCCMQGGQASGDAPRYEASLNPIALQTAVAHHQAGRLSQAEQLYRMILDSEPRHADALNGLGLLAHQTGASEFALELIANAIGLDPVRPNYYNNLGLPLQKLGRLDEAAAIYLKALALRPDYAEAHYNLGNTRVEQGRLAEAAGCFEAALAAKPDFVEAMCNLGNTLRGLGEPKTALAWYVRALAVKESPTAKSGFVASIRNHRFGGDNRHLRELVERAIVEPWGRPADLAAAAISLIKANPDVAPGVARATAAWPARLAGDTLYSNRGPSAVATDSLLQCFLTHAQVCDLDLERFLTSVRQDMLHAAEKDVPVTDEVLGLYCALARQCFINQYCFDCGEQELARAQSLRREFVAAGETGGAISPLRVATVAAYFPLHTLPGAAKLSDHDWSQPVQDLLRQQVHEPMEEAKCRASIPGLTAIDGAVSQAVRRQYEEHPYPTWIKLPPAGAPVSLNNYLRGQFPFAPLRPVDDTNGLDSLVAGCGTGLHALARSRQIAHIRVLAVDLSLSSLAYAMRKTREMGLANVEYGQADIMQLSGLGRSFDIVESVGVLHHLADPLAGWRVLTSLLRPGGLMRLGLYSAAARKTVTAARSFIAERGFRATPDDIRRCRQALIAAEDGIAFQRLLSAADFYGIGECRDLLFNVEEHHFTLPQLKSAIEKLNLVFIGFSLPPEVATAYRARFTGDKAMTNLDYWHAFETEHPDTFAGMYQFWVQKPDLSRATADSR